MARLERYEHTKRGTRYAVLDPAARFQTSHPIGDNERVVVYRDIVSGELWVRPAAEFFDGRFRLVQDGE